MTVLAGGRDVDRATEVLAVMEKLYRGQWTPEDVRRQSRSDSEARWRKDVVTEAARLQQQGILEARNDDRWRISAEVTLPTLNFERVATRNAEVARRERIWAEAKVLGAPDDFPAAQLPPLRLRAGQRGVYIDVQATRSRIAPAGTALSLLDLGHAYANARTASGVAYQLPRTSVPGRDRAEIAAVVSAHQLGVPIFMILPGGQPSTRSIRRAIVEDVNLALNVALVLYIGDDPLPPVPLTDGRDDFELILDDDETRWQRRKARPNQARFAFEVMKRYGARCAVCDITAAPVLEAAHIRPKSLRGSDDARNGIPLCSNHHRMYDANWFAFEPESTAVVFGKHADRGLSGVTRKDLDHLPHSPDDRALSDAWHRWRSRGFGKSLT